MIIQLPLRIVVQDDSTTSTTLSSPVCGGTTSTTRTTTRTTTTPEPLPATITTALLPATFLPTSAYENASACAKRIRHDETIGTSWREGVMGYRRICVMVISAVGMCIGVYIYISLSLYAFMDLLIYTYV